MGKWRGEGWRGRKSGGKGEKVKGWMREGKGDRGNRRDGTRHGMERVGKRK